MLRGARPNGADALPEPVSVGGALTSPDTLTRPARGKRAGRSRFQRLPVKQSVTFCHDRESLGGYASEGIERECSTV
jgi:hypothetical protein